MLWTVVLNMTMVGIGIALAMLGPTLLRLTDHLDVTLATAGSLFTFRASGYLSGALASGWLLDRLSNPAAIFLVPLCCACAGCCGIPFVTWYPLACLLFFFQGFTMGMLDVGGNVLLLALWRGSDWLNGFMHALHFFFGLGAFISPLLVGCWVARGGAAVDVWLATGVLMVPSCLGLLVLALAPQPKMTPEPPGESALNRIVVLTSVLLGVYVGSEVNFGGFIDTYAIRWTGADEASGAWLTSAYWGTFTLGRLAAAAITPYVNHMRYLVVHLGVAVVSIVLLTWATTTAGASADPSRWWLGVVTPSALFGFALAPLFPGAMLVAEELLGRGMSGMAASIMVAGAALGEMILPLLTGLLMDVRLTLFCWAQLACCVVVGALFGVNGRQLL